MQSRFVRWGGAAMISAIVGLSFAACTGATQQIVPETATPQASPTITDEPTQEAPTASPTVQPSPTPTPTPEITPSPTPAPGDVCVGSQENRQFFTDAAHVLKVQVYCAGTLPARWWLQSGNYNKGLLTIEYKKVGASVTIVEGPLTAALLIVPQAGSFIENAPFGDRTGELGLQDGAYYLQVTVGSAVVYQMTAPQAIGLATFKSIAAHMAVVPKS